jgi:hypothetical protein
MLVSRMSHEHVSTKDPDCGDVIYLIHRRVLKAGGGGSSLFYIKQIICGEYCRRVPLSVKEILKIGSRKRKNTVE